MTEKKKAKPGTIRLFVRRQILANSGLTDEQILLNWEAQHPKVLLTLKSIRRQRTLFEKERKYDQKNGLSDFYSSQAELLLSQYQNIEQLLGPADSDWTWPGEHCETLLREAIQRTLPPSLKASKGYVYGVRETEQGLVRSPEIDILVYDADQFAPIFSLDNFVIVRAESVRAVIQVKRTLDAGTLAKAVRNIVAAKQHIFATGHHGFSISPDKLFSGVVSFEDALPLKNQDDLSKSYATVLQPHISEFHHGNALPDFVGSLKGTYLHFLGMNTQEMLYQAFPSIADGRNIALPFLLFMLAKKIRPYGYHILPGFPDKLTLVGHVSVWEKPASPPGGVSPASPP